jgi:hypothetical protein
MQARIELVNRVAHVAPTPLRPISHRFYRAQGEVRWIRISETSSSQIIAALGSGEFKMDKPTAIVVAVGAEQGGGGAVCCKFAAARYHVYVNLGLPV